MSWNNECVDMLKKLGAAGQLASHIAKELGCVTRNAVIGRVHSLDLSNHRRTGSSDGSKA